MSSTVTLSVSENNTAETILANNGLTGTLTSNYRIIQVEVVITDTTGTVAAQTVVYPLNTVKLGVGNYQMVSKSFDLTQLNGQLNIAALDAGRYTLKLRAKVNGKVKEVLSVTFVKTTTEIGVGE